MLMAKFNFNEFCTEFYEKLIVDKQILKKIQSSNKCSHVGENCGTLLS